MMPLLKSDKDIIESLLSVVFAEYNKIKKEYFDGEREIRPAFATFLSEQTDLAEFFEQEKYSSYIKIREGVDRIVLFPRNRDYVVKFEYGGYYCSCKAEEEIRNKASEEDLENFFAEICFFKEIQGIPIYIQERVPTFSSEVREAAEEEGEEPIEEGTPEHDAWDDTFRDIIRDIPRPSSTYSYLHDALDTSDVYWFFELKQFCGLKKFCKLAAFLDKESIVDLHGDNVGYRGDGTPVFVDYAG